MNLKYFFIALFLTTIYAFIVIPSSQSARGDREIMQVVVIVLLTPMHIILITPSFIISKEQFNKQLVARIISSIFIVAYIIFAINNLNSLKEMPIAVLILLPCIITLFRFKIQK